MLNRLFILILLLSQLSIYADGISPSFSKIKQKIIAEKNIRDFAISANAKYLLVLRNKSQAIELLKVADFSLMKSMSLQETVGQNTKIDFIFTAVSRQSFIVGMGANNHLWEILYEDNPLPVYNGVMHDYKLGEGLVKDQSDFPVRIIKTADETNIPIGSYYFYPDKGFLFISRDKKIDVIQLDARQTIAKITLKEIPNLYQSKLKK